MVARRWRLVRSAAIAATAVHVMPEVRPVSFFRTSTYAVVLNATVVVTPISLW